MIQCTRRTARALLVTAFALAFSGPALAQHVGDAGQAPPPPPGPGRLTVQILGEAEDGALAGLPIVLYSLAPDGTPGLANAETDAAGHHAFSGVSNDPAIVYLIGVRFAEIPFGERVAFEEGATEARVQIRVSTPTDQIEGVRVEEVRARIDWMGDRVLVTEFVRLVSEGERVIRVTDDSIVERAMPALAQDFEAGPSSIGDDLREADGQIRFYGPLYPGEQSVEYRYSLPIAEGERSLRLPIELREASGRVVVVAGTGGIEASGADLVASHELTSNAGQPLAAWSRPGLRAGERIEIVLALPESRRDRSLLTIARADVWIDLDDTRLDANVDLQLVVAPGAPVSGTSDVPLLHVTLPPGASLQGVAPEAESMGLVPTADGGFDVVGPVGPGEHSLGYTWRMPSRPDGAEIAMHFPREVATLNVLVADTGLALDSERLHRRRPFRNRTRNYLHREAYNVGAGEVVDLRLEPLRATGLPQQTSLGLTLLAVVGAAFFLITPLRSGAKSEDPDAADTHRLRNERELLYADIADLDHDFETGKLDEADYRGMRDALRIQAIDLLRAERANDAAGETQATHVGPTEKTPTGAFCPGCGEPVDRRWRFCSHCGDALGPAPTGSEGADG